MGCKQTTIKSPSMVFPAAQTSQTSPTTPIYVKSALKKPPVNTRKKTGRLSFLKQKPPVLIKSVNFDENVEIKLRTPTPKQSRYESKSATQTRRKQTPNDDDNDFDGDDQLSSISSLDDIHNEQMKTSSNPSLQRNNSNGFWHKNNSVSAIVPSINNIKEKPQQPSVIITTYPTEILNNSTGTLFRVRRKVQYSGLSQTSSQVDPSDSSTVSFQRSTVPIQRPLSNTNTVLIEHHGQIPNDGSSPQTAYYAFSRRPIDKTSPTDK